MRVETRKIVTAFLAKRPARGKRTDTDGQQLRLFGKLIAWHEGDGVAVTLAGWPTVTTRDRLNGVADLYNGTRPFYQRGGDQFYDGREIGSHEVIVLDKRR